MFLGHFAAGLAAKKADSRPSLGTFFLASQFIDLLWPLFLLLGIEKVRIDPGNTAFTPLDFIYYPFTHSFLGVLIWAVIFGFSYYLIRKNYRGALIMGGLVLSHWFLDLLTHRPDLPLTFSGRNRAGLGLWNSVPLTLLVEGLIFAAGIYIYLYAVKAQGKRRGVVFWSLMIFLAAVYFINAFGSAPPSSDAVAYTGLLSWLLIAWGYWADSEKKTA